VRKDPATNPKVAGSSPAGRVPSRIIPYFRDGISRNFMPWYIHFANSSQIIKEKKFLF